MKRPKIFETTPERSKLMSKIKSKNGPVERKLAKALWHHGVRYRLNYKKLPGSPDIAITKYRIAIFVDGEFWHGYNWEQKRTRIKNNRQYWIDKIETNMNRDKRNNDDLFLLDWYVIRFWAHDVDRRIDYCVDTILDAISMRQ